MTSALALAGDASRGPALAVAGQPPGLTGDDDAAAWRVVSDEVHAAGALIVARLAVAASAIEDLTAAVRRAERAGFDALLLDPGEPGPGEPGPRDPGAADLGIGEPGPGEPGDTAGNAGWPDWLPAMVAAARAVWRRSSWLAAAVSDRAAIPSAVTGFAAQLVRAGCDLLWVSAPEPLGEQCGGHGARLAAAPLADRLRNELGVATAIACRDALLPDLDAAIAAGRADLVAVDRLPDGARRAL